MFFHGMKAKQETRQRKTRKLPKQNQHRNRKAETHTMKTKTAEKKNQPKMKATWV